VLTSYNHFTSNKYIARKHIGEQELALALLNTHTMREKINMAEETQIVEQQNSCKISVNAKGQWSGEVKVYADTIDNAMAKALEKAKELNDKIIGQNGL